MIGNLVEQFVMGLPCRDQAPYPEVRFRQKDTRSAEVLLDAFADGASAELTAVSQYINHHLTISDRDVSDLELCIALVEMKHLDLIGEAIEQLGGSPRFHRRNGGWWRGSEVAYGDSAIERLMLDIESEKAAISAYERMIADINEPGVTALIDRIIRDELVHLGLFYNALDMLRSRQPSPG